MGLSFDPTDLSFNRGNALYLAHASDIAYDRAPAAAARDRLGLEAMPFRNRVTRTRGFVGVCDTHAVLAFRGTEPVTLPNWLTDVVVRLVERHEYDGRVHHGFSAVLRRTWDAVEALIEQVPSDRPLFLTGHSMGGALAVLAACRLAKHGRPPAATYTFGAPRCGDRTFCAGYSLTTYRVVNGLDLVPEMPLASTKRLLPVPKKPKPPCYDHVNTFVYIDRDGTVTTEADVEPWHRDAVARAIATRGKSFFEGITDHLISNYIRRLEGQPHRRQTRGRRKVRG